MKLYLSSYKLGNNPEQLVDLVGDNKRTAVIANALDFVTDLERKSIGTKKEIDDLKELGFDPEEVDLRQYFEKPQELADRLSQYGLIWVKGGNTFVLRRAFKESGMDNWLIGQRENKDLVYAGYSAGVCVLSPSLRGTEITDDPNIVPKGYKKDIVWEGLDLIDFAFAPHYLSNHPESESMTREIEYYVKNGIKYKALSDGQVIILKKMNNNKFVKEGYNKIAYDYSATRDQFKNLKYLNKLNSLLKPSSTILDIGCGSGVPIDKFFIENGHKVIGIDISEEQIKLAQKELPQGKFEVKDMTDLKDGEFQVDAVTSFYAIFHIPKEDHVEMFRKINSFLKTKGFILVTMGASDWEGTEDFHGAQMFWSHFGPDKNLEIIKNAGFEILENEIDVNGEEKHQLVLAKKVQ